ncbi:hypothetical protein K290105B7_26270 [Anaerostipes caccae]|nr:hypothetical protein ANCC_31780 [Anaerostipes caccae L1-92]
MSYFRTALFYFTGKAAELPYEIKTPSKKIKINKKGEIDDVQESIFRPEFC